MSETTSRGSAGDIPVYCRYDEILPIDEIKPNPRNPNQHPKQQLEMLTKIIEQQGWRAPITISRRSGFIVRGHARLVAAKTLSGLAPVEWQDYGSEAEELADLIADNRIAELAVLDEAQIAELLREIDISDVDIDLTGFANSALEEILKSDVREDMSKEIAKTTLRERYLIPPFSILDARQPPWVERKRSWIKLGIKSELGRGDEEGNGLTFKLSAQPPSVYDKKTEYEKRIGGAIAWEDFAALFPREIKQQTTSIFDPVLCEVMYRWFCPVGGAIIDPFAGGSVRGVVAALCDYHYTGVDISERQINANKANWGEIDTTKAPPCWIVGDSIEIDTLVDNEFDFLFACPPYADLEVYSDNPRDISTMSYNDFLTAYRKIIVKAASKLRDDTFAAIIVGEVRAPDGAYRNFVGDTIQACIDAGLKYYNEAILITPYGSLLMRAGNSFEASRKLGKTHQNILIFCKGDAKKATKKLGSVEYAKEITEG